jgi:hypothetical protein
MPLCAIGEKFDTHLFHHYLDECVSIHYGAVKQKSELGCELCSSLLESLSFPPMASKMQLMTVKIAMMQTASRSSSFFEHLVLFVHIGALVTGHFLWNFMARYFEMFI